MTTRLDRTGASAGRGEPAVRLEDAVQHHGQPVQQDLRGEHHEHAGSDRDGLGVGAALPGAGMSSEATGPAARPRITLTGTSSTTVQVSRADEVWLVVRAASGSAPDRSAGRPAPAP